MAPTLAWARLRAAILGLALLCVPLALWAEGEGGFDPLFLGKLGFRSVDFPPVDGPFEGLDPGGAFLRADLSPDSPYVVYVFDARWPGIARAALAALEGRRAAWRGRVGVIALSPSAPAQVARALGGLSIGFPLVSGPGFQADLGLSDLPAWLVLGPGGRAVALRYGDFDWEASEGRALLEAILSAWPSRASNPATFLSETEEALLGEINLARTEPRVYVDFLRDYEVHIRASMLEYPGEEAVALREGLAAAEEAIAFLEAPEAPARPRGHGRALSGLQGLVRERRGPRDPLSPPRGAWALEGHGGSLPPPGRRRGEAPRGGPPRGRRPFREARPQGPLQRGFPQAGDLPLPRSRRKETGDPRLRLGLFRVIVGAHAAPHIHRPRLHPSRPGPRGGLPLPVLEGRGPFQGKPGRPARFGSPRPQRPSWARRRSGVGSYNLAIFGSTKLGRRATLGVLARIAAGFDLLAVQEVGSNSSSAGDEACEAILEAFVARINQEAGAGSYAFVREDQYAFIYRQDRLEASRPGPYMGKESFTYRPLVALFKVRGRPLDFAALTVHTRPGLAKTEVPALARAMDEVAASLGEPDVLCLGDFNADGGYYAEGPGESLAGFPEARYATLIPNDADTHGGCRQLRLRPYGGILLPPGRLDGGLGGREAGLALGPLGLRGRGRERGHRACPLRPLPGLGRVLQPEGR